MAQQEPAALRGIQYLRGHLASDAGHAAMIALALMKADIPHNDPAVLKSMELIRGRFDSGGAYSPAHGRRNWNL